MAAGLVTEEKDLEGHNSEWDSYADEECLDQFHTS